MNWGFVFNFRRSKHILCWCENFIKYSSTLDKKSINENDVLQMNPIKIDSSIKRTRYYYDIDGFLSASRL